MRCPTCGYQIDQYNLDRCPNCGNRLSTQAAQPTAENPPPQQPQYYPYPHYSPPSGYGQDAPPSYPMAPGYPPSGYPPQPPEGNYPHQGAYPPPPHYGYPQPWVPKTQPETGGGFAIAGLILGIVSIPIALFAICGYITSILGIIFSILGLRAPSKRTMATIGIVLSVLGFIASIASSIVGVRMMQHQYPITGSGSTTAGQVVPLCDLKTHQCQHQPPTVIDTHKSYTATIKTSRGNIVIALDAKNTPVTVNNFVFLSQQHWYDGTYFWRVETPGKPSPIDSSGALSPLSLIQGGSVADNGQDGQNIPGYTIKDELSTTNQGYVPGTIAMANTGQPNTGSAQFFIDTGDNSKYFSKTYTIFGHVTSGLDVAKKIQPKDKITSISITVK